MELYFIVKPDSARWCSLNAVTQQLSLCLVSPFAIALPATIVIHATTTIFLYGPYTGHPAPPTDLTALVVAPLQLNLSWDEPFAPPGVEIGYLVNAESLDMDSESTSEELHSTYYIFEGSHPCEKYRFTVVAVNTAGRSDRSQAINMSVPACELP